MMWLQANFNKLTLSAFLAVVRKVNAYADSKPLVPRFSPHKQADIMKFQLNSILEFYTTGCRTNLILADINSV